MNKIRLVLFSLLCLSGCFTVRETDPVLIDYTRKSNLWLRLQGFEHYEIRVTGSYTDNATKVYNDETDELDFRT